MSSLEFDAFDSRHLEAAGRLYADCFNRPPWEDGWSEESAFRRLEVLLSIPTARGCVALKEGRLHALALGHAEPWTDGSHFYLNELCVDPACQREGIGRALLGELARLLAEEGIVDIYLLTDRASPAEAFFRGRGFEDDADAVKLWRSASPTPTRGSAR